MNGEASTADEPGPLTQPGACPSCGENAIDGATFCEACGGELASDSGCVACPAPAADVDDNGYCTQCGHKQPDERDHLEFDLGVVAAVTDRGRRHHRNEDAVAVAVVAGYVIAVVCDGVSTTDNPEQASQAAVDAALARLTAAVRANESASSAMVDAVTDAQAAVVGVAHGSGASPSCTIVAAVAAIGANETHHDRPDDREIVLGWLGDSRAYWIAPEPRRLTVDHSWAAELISSGMDAAEAHAHPRAHTITRWLGADAPDVVPAVEVVHVEAPGTLLLCSDGLWNYAESAEVLAGRPELAASSLVDIASALTRFANESGGHDNITVALARI